MFCVAIAMFSMFTLKYESIHAEKLINVREQLKGSLEGGV